MRREAARESGGGKGISLVHRTARAAFGEAYKRGHITRNPVALAKAPRVEEEEVEPFDADEIRLIIKTALHRRNGVRFVVALALGCRQGEALGLKWERLDRQHRILRVKKALQRQTWQHGCADPHACGAMYHKTKPCKDGCRRPAATVLLLLGVQDRAVMDVMGWSTGAMKQRCMHVTEGLRRDVADQLNRYVWTED